jgi:hypothetical protein
MSQPEQDQQPPGTEAELTPKADHGETSYKGSGKLQGRTAVITGGDSGIGRAVAIAYAREGADLLISYLNEGRGRARDRAAGRRRRAAAACWRPATWPIRRTAAR